MTYEDLTKNFKNLNLKKIKKFLNFLLETNKTINLTSIIDENEILDKHIYDSLLITKVYNFDNKIILDVGSGGGFPGIPLAIMYKNAHFVLIDSVYKKVNYLRKLVKLLNLKNVDVIWERVEKISGKYDIIIARALAKLNKIVMLTKHLLNNNNVLIVLKSKQAFAELSDSQTILNKINLKLIKTQTEKLFNGDERINFIFRKTLN
ncbi:MAG: 16S rRNA (guanine(527)-N(7))-methyltransferase RsmG [Bacilli bacterium]|nr:16S rRNA (guanine(527)-N(7))-methyltransferase RsmG [Bacilli bacterium]